jgi:hypothetical protein
MPSTVSDVFAAAGLEPAGVVRWGTPVPETAPGVYVVALSDSASSAEAALPTAPLSRSALKHLLAVRPELKLDLAAADVDALVERLGSFWLADEVILYIGLAGQPLRTRVRQYYRTPLGARKQHAGGWWLKTLSVLDELWVHYAPTPHFREAETQMLRAFAEAMSSSSRNRLHDRERVMPFANLRGFDDDIKRHGISGATGDMPSRSAGYEIAHDLAQPSQPASADFASDATTPPDPVSAAADADAPGQPAPGGRAPLVSTGRVGTAETQRVTAVDIKAGRVRLPRPAKRLLPSERGDVEVSLRGRVMRARWDPKTEGPKERSGVLAFGHGKLDGLVKPDEVLGLRHERGGELQLR